MRKISYAGGTFYTGDELAGALLDYAAALARASTSARTSVLARTTSGVLDRLDLVFGPASEILSEPVEIYGREIVDEAAVAHLHRLAAELAPVSSPFESPNGTM